MHRSRRLHLPARRRQRLVIVVTCCSKSSDSRSLTSYFDAKPLSNFGLRESCPAGLSPRCAWNALGGPMCTSSGRSSLTEERAMPPWCLVGRCGTLLAAIGIIIGLSGPAHAHELPWCVEKAGGAYIDCSYYTHRQCIETSRGLGPCIRNARFDWHYYLRGEPAPFDIDPNRSAVRRRGW
jgi:hypothetical protein